MEFYGQWTVNGRDKRRSVHSPDVDLLALCLGSSRFRKKDMHTAGKVLRVLATAFALTATSQGFAAEGGVWSVSKSSGEVWITSGEVQQASLKPEDNLKPGDTIRTGRNGRVFLIRDEESILIAPNSVVALPAEVKEGLSTTIIQKAGSILLEVEKRNVKHFEVETPYLAAVVKGTQFLVSVNATSTSVDVIRGQVEVADFRSGQVAQVMPGQLATASAHGKPGLSLSGSGTFAPIEQGRPRASTIQQLMVPKTGLSAPRHAANGQLNRALGHGDHAAARINSSSHASLQPGHGATRISASLGEVRQNFHKVTHGLAHEAISTPGSARSDANKDTVWTSREAAATAGAGNGSSQGNSNDGSSANAAASISAAATSGVTGPIAAVTGAGNGNGNGANGNGNNGNSHAYGHNK